MRRKSFCTKWINFLKNRRKCIKKKLYMTNNFNYKESIYYRKEVRKSLFSMILGIFLKFNFHYERLKTPNTSLFRSLYSFQLIFNKISNSYHIISIQISRSAPPKNIDKDSSTSTLPKNSNQNFIDKISKCFSLHNFYMEPNICSIPRFMRIHNTTQDNLNSTNHLKDKIQVYMKCKFTLRSYCRIRKTNSSHCKIDILTNLYSVGSWVSYKTLLNTQKRIFRCY